MAEQKQKRTTITKVERRIQAEQTTAFAAPHLQNDRKARKAKMARLRALRMAQEKSSRPA